VEIETEESQGISVLVAYVESAESLYGLEGALRGYKCSLEDLFGRSVHCHWTVEPLKDEDWREAWKRYFRVNRVSQRFVVKPPWETYEVQGHEVVLDIDPGQAFGTGLHASTRLCLQGIEEILENPRLPHPRTGLDVGTGTGILAIAMARVGLEQVVAIDPDPEAIEAAQHNVSLNDVSERVRIRRIPVEGLREGEFDLVVANLTGPILRRSSHVLRRRLSPNGILLVSGFLEEEVEAVERPFLRRGLKLLERRSDEMWCALWMKCGG